MKIKALLLALSIVALTSPALRAQNITPEERAKAVKYLEKTRAEVLAATKGLSAAQWNYKPGTNRWSVAEVTEHIAAAEDFFTGMVKDKVLKAPARTDKEDVKAIDEFVLLHVPDRSTKVQAPDPLVPTNRYGTPKASLKHFEESRAKTIAFLKKADDLRAHATESTLGKSLDGYQWILMEAAHSERHVKQIDEVKADPGYPKK